MWGLRVAWRAVWTAAFAEFAMARSHRSSTRSTRGCPPSASPHAGDAGRFTDATCHHLRGPAGSGPVRLSRYRHDAADHLETESPGIPAGQAEELRMRMRPRIIQGRSALLTALGRRRESSKTGFDRSNRRTACRGARALAPYTRTQAIRVRRGLPLPVDPGPSYARTVPSSGG